MIEPMSTEGATIDATQVAEDDGRMFCYRHPGRETYVRCGRCDRPICTKCAMQGPVGFRCKSCGTLANDPLTSFRPSQIAAGFAVATGGGILLGLVSGYFGWFSIIIAFIGGGFLTEAVTRFTGFKRGPVMVAIVLGGIVVGSLVGTVIGFYTFFANRLPPIDGLPQFALGDYLLDSLPWLLVSILAACGGAYRRLR